MITFVFSRLQFWIMNDLIEINRLDLYTKSVMVFINSFTHSLQSSLNGSTSSLPDSTGRSYTSSFSVQSGAGSPVYHHAGRLSGGMV